MIRGPRGAAPLAAALASSALAFVAVVALGASPLTREEFPLDDAWIHLDYARGLLRDGAPTYNPGVAEAGFTSPLWVLAGALALLASRATALPAALLLKGASALCGAVAAAAIARGAARQGASARAALLVAVVAPLGPWWCAGAASGMEVALTAALLALALTAALDGNHPRAGGLLALATLARPECAVCVPALLLARRGDGARAAVARSLPAAVAAALWSAYCLAATGRPLPNTFYVKAQAPGLTRSLAFLFATLGEDGWTVALVLVALAVAGVARARRPSLAWAALCVAPIVAVLATRALNPHVLLYLRRYLYPFLMLLWWPAALGITALVDAVAARSPSRPRVLAALGVGLACAAVVPSVLAARALHAAQCLDVATFHTLPAREIDRVAGPSDVVAVEGAGASRYFGGRSVVDLVGLNEHALARSPLGSTAHLCHLLARRPGWFVVPAGWVARYEAAWRFTPYAAAHSDRYAQLDPPARHTVLLLRAEARAEALARCPPLSAERGATRAPPTGP